MKIYAILKAGQLSRIFKTEDLDRVAVAERKGYKEVIYPAKTDYQLYSNPHIDGDTILFDVVNMTTQQIYDFDYQVWEQQMRVYQQTLPDFGEHLIQFLINEGTINPLNLPASLKQLYQDKVAHRTNEPTTP